MKSLEPFKRRLDYLITGQREPPDLKKLAWIARFTPDELGIIGHILIDHTLAGDTELLELTQEEIAILEPLLERPIEPITINRDEPVCYCCRWRQPAFEREGSWPICDECYAYMVGLPGGK